jgi:hypothetical protein
MNHLSEAAKAAVELSREERFAYMDKIWIGYPQATNILKDMKELLEHPPSHRMPNILLVGNSNNGKSTILNHFARLNKAYVSKEDDLLKAPVLLMQVPSGEEGDFYDELLDTVKAPAKKTDRINRKRELAINALKSLHVKVLILDEFHSLLGGSYTKQRNLLGRIKYLSNKLSISIIAAGTKDAFQAIQADDQMASRFTPYVLPRWKMDDEGEYQSLLASFNKMLPLKKDSNLSDDDIAAKILLMTNRTIGQISKLLQTCAKAAIESGEERITQKTLAQVRWKTPKDIERERLMEI